MICPPDTDSLPETISGYSFQPSDLRVMDRRPGISAFMRIRNGEDFLELTIRSHIRYFDEIVAVYNQCTDQTSEILMRLQKEFGRSKLRVIHYADPVFPPGSEGHAVTDPRSPGSLVNYYNCALAATRFQYATKLDDDHLAIGSTTQAITSAIRMGSVPSDTMFCFSGLNVFRREDGSLGILQRDPVSGGGDIGFFRVTPQTCFVHDRRFERFQRGGAKRSFAGFLYWHLKYIKADMGFGNYELSRNPGSRYARRKAALQNSVPATLNLQELAQSRKPSLFSRLRSLFSEKWSLVAARDAAIGPAFPDASVHDAILRTVSSEFCDSSVISGRPADHNTDSPGN